MRSGHVVKGYRSHLRRRSLAVVESGSKAIVKGHKFAIPGREVR